MTEPINTTFDALLAAYSPLTALVKDIEGIYADYDTQDSDDPDAAEDALCRLLTVTQKLTLLLTGTPLVNWGTPHPITTELTKPLEDFDRVHFNGLSWCKTRRQQLLDQKAQAEQSRKEALEAERVRLAHEKSQKAAYEAETAAWKQRLGLPVG